MDINQSIKIIKSMRSFYDKIILFIFRKTINRFTTIHLCHAKEMGLISNSQLYNLDSLFKKDISVK